MEKEWEKDYASFGDYFERNEFKKGEEAFAKRIRAYETKSSLDQSSSDRLGYISAQIFICRYQLLVGNIPEVRQKLEDIYQLHLNFLETAHHRLLAEYYHTLSELAFCEGNYEKNIHYAEKAIEYKKSGINFSKKDWKQISNGQSLVLRGKGHFKKGDYHTALICYFQAFINYQRTKNKQKNYLTGRVLTLIAEVFIGLKQTDTALALLRQAIDFLKQSPAQHIYLSGAKILMARCLFLHSTQADFETAAILLQDSEDALVKNFNTGHHRYLANLYNNKAHLHLMRAAQNQESHPVNAYIILELFSHEIMIRQSLSGGGKIKMSSTYNETSGYLLQYGYHRLALEAAQLSLAVLFPGLDTSKENPSEEAIQSTTELSYLLGGLLHKAKALYALFKEHDKKNKEEAYDILATLRLARIVVRLMRKDIGAPESKLELSAHVRPVFELYVELVQEMLETAKAQKDVKEQEQLEEELFGLLPDCHASFLLETILDPHAERFLDLLNSQESNSSQITLYEIQEMLLNPDKGISFNTYRRFLNLEFRRRKMSSRNKLVLKGGIDFIDRDISSFNLQNFYKGFHKEDEDATAVYYFLHSKKGIYAFVISGWNSEFNVLHLGFGNFNDAEQLNAAIMKLVQRLNQDEISSTEHPEDATKAWNHQHKVIFLNQVTALHSLLIRPLEQHKLLITYGRVYIIGDQNIAFLPFEVLIKGSVEELAKRDYSLMPFLITQYKISYHASIAALFMIHKQGDMSSSQSEEPTQRTILHNSLQILAPEHISNGTFKHLVEMELIAEHCAKEIGKFGQQIETINLSNRKDINIKEKMTHYEMIHFIAHSTRRPSIILNWPDELLSPDQVAGMSLNAFLVMLTTCQSGSGQLFHGESPITLSTAFLMAHASNIYFTFFEINFDHAAKMSSYFLSFLQRGENFVTAIQKAKLQMLGDPRTAAPQCWAAPAFLGDQTARIIFKG